MRAPHFGGIWEAAVKVAKGHLYRSLQNTKLSFEELATALCEIEAVMNSRPITPLTNDPNDFEALTPGHLLIGTSMRAIPEPSDANTNPDILPYWRRINNVKSHFWQRWQKEYLQELQQRSKWASKSPNIAVGSMVVVHEDNLPPMRWSLGRIQKTFPGEDGNVRVAEIRTAKGTIKRPIHKLALLPC
ncbi:uncharacterized protein LOC129953584 [Eupeodes corollae]|uniref:uncharacterized protein LOC129953584 n=1 Tax=Eupeodes corollae TaxID=290404 RepID=UPI0024912B81|nr:uncharacterized protein LOC129953584 [Eupeodes corollae]